MEAQVHQKLLDLFFSQNQANELEKSKLNQRFLDCLENNSKLKPYSIIVVEFKKFIYEKFDLIYKTLVLEFDERCVEDCSLVWLEILNVDQSRIASATTKSIKRLTLDSQDIISCYTYDSKQSLDFPVFKSTIPIEMHQDIHVPETFASIARKEKALQDSYKKQLDLYFDPKQKFIEHQKQLVQETLSIEEEFHKKELSLKVKTIKQSVVNNVYNLVKSKTDQVKQLKSKQDSLLKSITIDKQLENVKKVNQAKELYKSKKNVKEAVQSKLIEKKYNGDTIRKETVLLKHKIDVNAAKELKEKQDLVLKIKSMIAVDSTTSIEQDNATYLTSLSINELKLKLKTLKSEKELQVKKLQSKVHKTNMIKKKQRNAKLENLERLKLNVQSMSSLSSRSEYFNQNDSFVQSKELKIHELQSRLQELMD